jgi:hypothetical protein
MVEQVPARFLWLAAGFTVWAVAFVVIYTIQALGCAYGWSFAFHRGLLVAAFAAHVALILWMILRAPRGRERRFLSDVTLWTLWAALVATVFTYAPAFFVSACI